MPHTYEWVVSHIWVSHVTCIYIWTIHHTRPIYICDVTYSHFMWHDVFIYMTWLIHIFDTTHSDVSFLCLILIACGMTHSHDSFYVTWLIHMTNSHFISFNWSHMQMRHAICVWHTCANVSCHVCEWVMSRMRMSHVTYANESCHMYGWVIQYMCYTHHADCDSFEVMSRICMSHVTYTNESNHIYEWVVSHICVSRVTCMNTSSHSTVTPSSAEIVLNHVTHVNASCRTSEWVMPHM